MRVLGIMLICYLYNLEMLSADDFRRTKEYQCGLPGVRRSGVKYHTVKPTVSLNFKKPANSSILPNLKRSKPIARQNNRGNGKNNGKKLNEFVPGPHYEARPNNNNGNGNNQGPQNGPNGQNNGYNNNQGPHNGPNGQNNGYNNNQGPQNGPNGQSNGYNNNQGSQNGPNGPNNGYNNNQGPQNGPNGPNNGYNNNQGPHNGPNGQNNGYNNNQGPQNGPNGQNNGYNNNQGQQNVPHNPNNGYDNGHNQGPQNGPHGPNNGYDNGHNQGPNNGPHGPNNGYDNGHNQGPNNGPHGPNNGYDNGHNQGPNNVPHGPNNGYNNGNNQGPQHEPHGPNNGYNNGNNQGPQNVPHGPNNGYNNGNNQGPQNEVYDPVAEELNKLDASRTERETSMCTRGPTFMMDCNKCVCVGGMLYVCTAKRCVRKLKGGKKILGSYHEKPEPECVEGEKVLSFDCNKCNCRGGNIICTKMACATRTIARQRQTRCSPNDPVTSPDNCNTCLCGADGQVYCTQNVCGIEPVKLDNRKAGCVPKKYYSLTDNPFCKECYCIDGSKAFCHTGLCEEKRDEQYSPLMLMKKTHTVCNKGAVLLDACTRCICTYKHEWKCYTRMIDSCSGKDDFYKKNPNGGTQTTHNPNQDRPHDPNQDNNNMHTTSPHPGVPPSVSLLHPYTALTLDMHSSPHQGEDTDQPHYPNYDQTDDPHMHTTAVEVYTTTTTTTPKPSSDEDYDTPQAHKLGKCITGKQFTQGMSSSCQGCFCGRQSTWICYSHAGACRGYNDQQCQAGKLVKNLKTPCSACYCGADGEYMCATDEKCSTTIKQSLCKALECEDHCVRKGMVHGYCMRDKCKCAGGSGTHDLNNNSQMGYNNNGFKDNQY